jgi:hypothetical protein
MGHALLAWRTCERQLNAMLGFKSTISAKRYCQSHGELRDFLC